ncbi:MAG: glutaminyl-peptide cyclotransferase [Paracoccaceae bacterium]|nr:glutaminyl-peptide cyclotransferase [Paracoccaceae bacterium]
MNVLKTIILVIYLFPWNCTQSSAVIISNVDVIKKYPHDNTAFTQGLEFHAGRIYESTGLRGSSELRKIELETGRVIQRRILDPKFFGEGITILQNKVFQLTWKSGKGFVYDLDSFDLDREFKISGEGWGLSNDGNNLLLSNGSNQILFLDPQTFQVLKRVSVTLNDKPQYLLNELEYVAGEIWANVWKKDEILRIDPLTGIVLGILDVGTISERLSDDDVANGIAWDEEGRKIYITGKFWSYIYEIKMP